MKDIKLKDMSGVKTIRMCEKHFRIYRKHLDGAQSGGTSYFAEKTNKRGCILCKREV